MPVKISDYYVLNPVYEPPRIEYREFAFVKNGRFFRHRAFWNIRDLRTFLVSFAPVGADLIFDIDCDVLPMQTIEEAYFYALKLVDIMRHVYGFKEVLLVFSGRRGGSPPHVQDFDAIRLNLDARKEIIEDLTANPDSSYVVPIDPVVTGDMSRVIRLPGSLYVRGDHAGMCRALEIPEVEKINNYHTQEMPIDRNRARTVPILSY